MAPPNPPLPTAMNLPFQFAIGQPELGVDVRVGRGPEDHLDAAMFGQHHRRRRRTACACRRRRSATGLRSACSRLRRCAGPPAARGAAGSGRRHVGSRRHELCARDRALSDREASQCLTRRGAGLRHPQRQPHETEERALDPVHVGSPCSTRIMHPFPVVRGVDTFRYSGGATQNVTFGASAAGGSQAACARRPASSRR